MNTRFLFDYNCTELRNNIIVARGIVVNRHLKNIILGTIFVNWLKVNLIL